VQSNGKCKNFHAVWMSKKTFVPPRNKRSKIASKQIKANGQMAHWPLFSPNASDRKQSNDLLNFTSIGEKEFLQRIISYIVKHPSAQLHIKSLKHVRSKEWLLLKQQHEVDIEKSLKKYGKEFHTAGETLPDTTRIFRVKVVTALLKATVPLSKLDSFRDLLKEHGYAPCDSLHLRRLISFILQDKISKLKQDINGRHMTIVFDGMTRV